MEESVMDRLRVAEFNRTSLPPVVTVGRSSDPQAVPQATTAPSSGDLLIVHSVLIVEQSRDEDLEPIADPRSVPTRDRAHV